MVRGIDFLPQEMLLDLPPELIQLVLERCTTTAFLQAAFSCRILYGIASSCREAVLHHLRQTPGPKRDLGRYGTKDLFRKLVSRSIRELYGAQFHANCKAFTFKGHGIDVRASSISKTGQVLSLVARGRPAIYLFRVHKSQFALIKLIKPILGTHAKVEVLRTAFAGDGGFYSLQRVTPVIDGDYGPRWKRGKIYFVHHVLASLSPSHAGSVRICGFPLHEDYEPKAFAVANRNTFAISWQHAAVEDHEVMLYTSLTEFATYSSGVVELGYCICPLIHGVRNWSSYGDIPVRRFDSSHEALDAGPVVGLAFNHGDQELLYYAKAQTIFGSSQSLMRSHNCPHENEYIVSFDKLLNLRFAVGIPFYGVHGVGPEWTVNEWEYICRRIYLSFGMATHRTEGWTVACILKSVGRCETTTNCDYVLDLADGLQRADWMLVARLWGFQRPTNSIGCVVAASKRGSRLAVANWNVLYVWALDMSALTATYPSEFYPPWSWRDTPKAVDLGPVVIQLHAVCFQLRFLEGENELMAITDRGVMHWDLSPLGKGERRYHEVQVIPH